MILLSWIDSGSFPPPLGVWGRFQMPRSGHETTTHPPHRRGQSWNRPRKQSSSPAGAASLSSAGAAAKPCDLGAVIGSQTWHQVAMKAKSWLSGIDVRTIRTVSTKPAPGRPVKAQRDPPRKKKLGIPFDQTRRTAAVDCAVTRAKSTRRPAKRSTRSKASRCELLSRGPPGKKLLDVSSQLRRRTPSPTAK